MISFLLLIFLLCPLDYAVDSPVWSGIERIVAVADIHGSYYNFIKILNGTKIIDNNLNWVGGKTHLVQTGDILDRGPDAGRTFDLLKKLEKQAETAGGAVHVLLGNHEVMNIVGIAIERQGYVTPEQFTTFLPDKYREKREKVIRNKFLKSQNSNEGLEQEIKKFWSETIRKDKEAREIYNNYLYQQYGEWLLSKRIAIKINDIIFTHGGINKEYSTWKLKAINARARREMREILKRKFMSLEIVYQPNAPQWFRGLINNSEEDYSDDVEIILKNLSAHYMVVGHTVRPKEIIDSKKLDRFQGRIWGMDTGISDYYGGNLSALIIENGVFKVWWR